MIGMEQRTSRGWVGLLVIILLSVLFVAIAHGLVTAVSIKAN